MDTHRATAALLANLAAYAKMWHSNKLAATVQAARDGSAFAIDACRAAGVALFPTAGRPIAPGLVRKTLIDLGYDDAH